MKINNHEIKEIRILTDEDELIISITDKDVIEKDGYKVCLPVINRDYCFVYYRD